jgi:hypothetical protein
LETFDVVVVKDDVRKFIKQDNVVRKNQYFGRLPNIIHFPKFIIDGTKLEDLNDDELVKDKSFIF